MNELAFVLVFIAFIAVIVIACAKCLGFGRPRNTSSSTPVPSQGDRAATNANFAVVVVTECWSGFGGDGGGDNGGGGGGDGGGGGC